MLLEQNQSDRLSASYQSRNSQVNGRDLSMGKFVANDYGGQVRHPSYERTIVELPDPKASIFINPNGYKNSPSTFRKAEIAVDIAQYNRRSQTKG